MRQVILENSVDFAMEFCLAAARRSAFIFHFSCVIYAQLATIAY
jgi:hypothetical protein